jgi:hypothetical protein
MIGYFIIAVVLILLIFAIFRYGISCNKSVIKSLDTEDFLKLKTGDLVFVSYRNLLGNSVRILSSSEWSHSGMIYKEENGEMFVLEVADYGGAVKQSYGLKTPLYSGVIKIPYTFWLKLNKNHKIGFRSLDDEVYDSIKDNVFSEFMKLKIYKQQKLTDISSWKRLMFFEAYNEEEILLQDKVTCVEFIVLLLQNLGIMEKIYKPSSYYPCDLATKYILNCYDEIKII